MRLLISAGADVTYKDEDGATPLHDCAASGHEDIVHILLEHMREICSENTESKATSFESFVNTADSDGDTALHAAARGNHAKVCDMLIHAGACKEIRNKLSKLAIEESSVVKLFEECVIHIYVRI